MHRRKQGSKNRLGFGFGRRNHNEKKLSRAASASVAAMFEQLESRTLLSTVSTDKPDYLFGETAQITGTDFMPWEPVLVTVQNAPGSGSNNDQQNQPFTVKADELGSIATGWLVNDPDAIGATYIVTATGLSSGDVATTTFTDSSSITAATVNSGSSVTVKGGTSISIGVTVKNTAGSNWQSTGYLISTTPPGTYTVVDTPDHNGNGTFSESFSASAPAAEGTYNLYLIAYRGAGGTSPDGTLTLTGAVVVDNTAPVISAQTASPDPFSPNGDAVKDATAISYSLSEASTVTIKIYDSSNNLVRTLVNGVSKSSGANSDTWNGKNDSNATVPDGTYTYKIDATDVAGNVATEQTGTVTVDDTAPAVAITTITTPINNLNQSNFSASGTAEPNASISVVVTDGTHTSPAETTTATGGSWSVSGLNASTLNDGPITYRATATDSAGNSATAAQGATKDATAPTVTDVTSPTADGSYKAGQAILITVAFGEAVFVNGTPQLALNSGGTASYSSGSGSGTLTFSYTVLAGQNSADLNYVSTSSLTLNGGAINDASGNDAALTLPALAGANSLGTHKNIVIDTTAPAVAFTSTPTINNNNKTAVSVSGTGENGNTIAVTITDGTNTTTVANTTVASGVWTVSGINASGLNDGPVTYSVTATDAALNSTTVMQGATKDTVAPTVLNVTSTTADGAYKATQAITITVGFSKIVLVTGTPLLSLNSGGSASYSSGTGTSTLTFTYTVASGQNSPDLDYTSASALTLNGGTIRDADGNNATLTLAAPNTAGSLGANKNIVIDTIAPALSVVSVTNPVNISNKTNAGASGTTDLGGGITITMQVSNGGHTPTVTTLADNAGNWSFSGVDVSGLPDGTIGYAVTATDAAGNATTTLVTATKDTVVPNLSLSTVTAPVNIVNQSNASASGTADSGALASVTATDGTITTSAVTDTANGSGHWSVSGLNVSSLSDGTITYTATTTDAAGNTTTQTMTALKDTVAPTVTVSAVQTSPTNANPITFNIHFSETVSGFSAAGITVTNATKGTFSGSGQDYTIQVAPSGQGAVTCQVVANAAQDAGNNGNAISNTASVTFDSVAPTVTINQANTQGDPTNGSTIHFSVVFSESVSDFATGDVTLSGSASATTATVSGSGTTYDVSVSGMAGNGTVVASLLAGVAHDTAGNASAASTSTDNAVTYDITQPTVSNVTSNTANGSYGVGQMISIQVSFSESVNVTGTPQLSLNSGGTASYNAGSGSSTLTFIYTVAGGQNTPDLDYLSVNSLSLNGGAIKDAATNDANLTLPSPGSAGSLGFNKNIVIDTTAPAVTNVTSTTPDGAYKAAAVITITVGFSKTVVVTGTPLLSLNSGGSASYTSGSGTSTLTFTYTVAAGQNSADLDYTSSSALTLNGGTIKDTATNAATLTLATPGSAGSLGLNKNIVIDTVAPALGITSVTDPVNLNNQHNASASGTTDPNSTITIDVFVSKGSSDTSTYSTTADSSGNWTINGIDVSSLADGQVTYNVTATDPAGNSTSTTAKATKDTTLPSVTISTFTNPVNAGNQTNASASGSGTNGATITLTVTDAGSVHTTTTYTTTTSGNSWSITGIDVSGLNDGAVSYNVTVTTSNGNTNSTSASATKNTAVVAAAVTNVSSTKANGTYGVGQLVSIQVSFTQAVNVTGTPQLALNSGGTASYANGSGTSTLTFTYTVGSGQSSADLDYLSTSSLTLNGGTIKDAALNNANLTLPAPGSAGSLGANKDIVIDTTAPTITNITSTTANGTYDVNAVISITVGFSEAVNVTGTPQLALNSGGTASYTSGSGTSTLTFTYTVSAGENSADLDYTNSTALALNGGSISDTASNAAVLTLPTPGATGSLGANKQIVIDTSVATVTGVSSTNANGPYGLAQVISIQVNFDKSVNVTGTPLLALNSGGAASYTSGSGTNTLTFTYTVGAGQNAVPLDEASSNALTLNGGTISNPDGSANLLLPAPGTGGSLGNNKFIVIDTTAPVVTNVTSTTANGTYGPAALISVVVSFSEAVTVTGTPQLTLNSGGTASYSSGSGTNSLTFTYTVAAGDSSADLDYTSTTALSLNGGTIQDTANNAANLALPAPAATGSLGANKNIVIDTAAPTLTNFQINDGGAQRSMVNQLVLTFSKPVLLDPGAITLVRTQGGALTVGLVIGSMDNKTFMVSFTGGSIIGGSLADGVYNISIDHTKVHSVVGNVGMSADFSRNFHRLFGDIDGDGDCDATDQLVIRNDVNTNTYVWYLDYDGNNAVDASDYMQARSRTAIHFVYTP